MSSLSWLYVDLNSFFASCEQQENPELRGKPVAVVPLFADTTSCLAASYEAKRFGVKTGVKVGDARRMCPGIKFVESRHDIYIQYHHRVKTAIETCVPIDGVLSVDEFAARLTGSQQKEEQAIHVAHQIKIALKRDIGDAVTASIGISVNRFLAKIATDMKKPDGLTVIKKSDLPTKLHSLALRDIPGIGVKTEERLSRQKIFTVQELLIQSKEKMNQLWGGIWGERMYYWLRGEEVDLPPSKTRMQSKRKKK
jgi:DNA polymerase-4